MALLDFVRRKHLVPRRSVDLANLIRHRLQIPTARLRPLPSFLIVGAQKAGTTSLYEYLTALPQVSRSLRKEIHFFDLEYEHGTSWYRAYFQAGWPRPVGGGSMISGDATPAYLFHPAVPARVATTLPNALNIVLLRDPVERAISHYYHEVRGGFETLGIEEAIEAETERLAREAAAFAAGTLDFGHVHHSYVARGRYAEQLERWLQHIPHERLHIVQAERLFERPHAVVSELCNILGVTPPPPNAYAVANAGDYERSGPDLSSLRERLADTFHEDNEQLFELLGERYDWQ